MAVAISVTRVCQSNPEAKPETAKLDVPVDEPVDEELEVAFVVAGRNEPKGNKLGVVELLTDVVAMLF